MLPRHFPKRNDESENMRRSQHLMLCSQRHHLFWGLILIFVREPTPIRNKNFLDIETVIKKMIPG
jgi:hypothetical protein